MIRRSSVYDKLFDIGIPKCSIRHYVPDNILQFKGYGWYLFQISMKGLSRDDGILSHNGQDTDGDGKLLITGIDDI